SNCQQRPLRRSVGGMTRVFLAGIVVEGRRCVVFGGDREACAKARALEEAGADVEVVATEITHPEFGAWLQADGPRWRNETPRVARSGSRRRVRPIRRTTRNAPRADRPLDAARSDDPRPRGFRDGRRRYGSETVAISARIVARASIVPAPSAAWLVTPPFACTP